MRRVGVPYWDPSFEFTDVALHEMLIRTRLHAFFLICPGVCAAGTSTKKNACEWEWYGWRSARFCCRCRLPPRPRRECPENGGKVRSVGSIAGWENADAMGVAVDCDRR